MFFTTRHKKRLDMLEKLVAQQAEIIEQLQKQLDDIDYDVDCAVEKAVEGFDFSRYAEDAVTDAIECAKITVRF